MAKAIQEALQIQPELIESGGGVFEVVADGELIFSKKQLKRFPTHEEILEKLGAG